MKNTQLSLWILFLAIPFFEITLQSARAQTPELVSCTYSEICRLGQISFNELSLKNYQFETLTSMVGDPHEFEPSAEEIKKLLSAKFLIAGPHELNPWIEKIQFQRKKLKLGETFALRLDKKFLALYPGSSNESLSHFWLYPKVFCDFKNQFENRILKDHPSLPKTNIEACHKEAQSIESELKATLAKKNLPIVLTHDAIMPILKLLGPKARNIVAIKGSGHHSEATPQSVKNLYDALKAPKVIWIIESGIHIPENILAKKRTSDYVIEIDTAHSKGFKYFQVLEDLNLKLKGLK